MPGRSVILAAAVCAAALALAGCRPSVAAADARDRATPAFERAVALEQVGKLDEAIAQYDQMLLDHPRQFSVHLHLALLLHDHRQDYIGAVYHYKRYLALRPGGEKDEMIEKRIRLAEQLLAAQLLRQVGEVAGVAQSQMSAEITALNGRVAALEGEKAALTAEREKLARELQTAQGEAQRLRRLVESMRLEETEAAGARAKPSVLSRILTRREADPPPAQAEKLPPLGSDAIAAARREAERLAAGDAPAAEPSGAEGAAPRAPALRTYVVQPGDTLFGIAERHYGDGAQWTKVRDANQKRIGADGQVRAGQILEIP